MDPNDFPLKASGEVNLAALDHLVDWTHPSAAEAVMLGAGGEPDYKRLIEEVIAHPVLAKMKWGGGATLLDVAMCDHQNGLAEHLIARGADVNVYRELTGQPIHSAIEAGNLEGVRLLISNGSRLDIPDRRGMPPLHSAAVHRRPEIVQLLLEHGARIDAHDSDDLTALERAARAYCGESVIVLVNFGATTGDRDSNEYIDELRKNGWIQ